MSRTRKPAPQTPAPGFVLIQVQWTELGVAQTTGHSQRRRSRSCDVSGLSDRPGFRWSLTRRGIARRLSCGPDRVCRDAWQRALGEPDERAQVAFVEAAEEELARDAVVGDLKFAELAYAGVCQPRMSAAPVLRIGLPLNEPQRRQSIDYPADPARAAEVPNRKLSETQTSIRGGHQDDEDAVFGVAETMRLLQLPVDRAHDRRVEAEQRTPRVQLELRERFGLPRDYFP